MTPDNLDYANVGFRLVMAATFQLFVRAVGRLIPWARDEGGDSPYRIETDGRNQITALKFHQQSLTNPFFFITVHLKIRHCPFKPAWRKNA